MTRAKKMSTDSLRIPGDSPRFVRREILGGMLGASVLSIGYPLASKALNPIELERVYGSMPSRNVLITGANSGIGRAAVEILSKNGHNVYVVCRTLDKAEATITEIKTSLGDRITGTLTPMECDVSDLESVRKFARDFRASGAPLNVLVANAGISLNANYKGDEQVLRSKDGFELTVATNYFGHFLLVNMLLPTLEKSGSDSRVVITGSEVHDPTSAGGSVGPGATLGDLRGLESKAAMVDGGVYDANKAYKDSKLLDIMFALELQRRLKSEGSTISVNSFGPGLITKSGFFRNQNSFFSSLFDFAASDLFHVTETVEFGGSCIAYMALSKDLDGKGGLWFNAVEPGRPKFEQLQPSTEARDTAKARELYDKTMKLVGLQVM